MNRVVKIAWTLLISIAVSSATAFAAVSDPSGTGPFAVSSQQVKITGVTIPHVSYPVDIWAQVWYPTELSSGPFPLVLVLHGNHGVCRLPGSTDDLCPADPPTCPAGYIQTPNHLGYNYFTSKLASWGYIVASINANAINCRNYAIDDRGRLIQEHLRRWVAWNSASGAAPFGTLFSGRVNLSKVALVGHSRGGEGVRAGYDYLRNDLDPPSVDVPAVFEIAPTDFGVPQVFNDFNVNFSVVLPGCDGDVSDNEGMRAYDRAQAMPETIFPSPKAQQFVWGACHNFFNSQWSFDDANCFGPDQPAITRPTEQKIGSVYVMGFVRSYIGGEDFTDLFTNDQGTPGFVKTTIDNAFAQSRSDILLVDDFSAQGSPAINNLGATVTPTNISLTSCDGSSCATPSNVWIHDPVQHAGKLSWPHGSTGTPKLLERLAAPGKSIDVSSYGFLSFRVAEQNSSSNPANPSVQNFSVTLRDNKGNQGTLQVSRFKKIHFPVGSGDRKSILATARVPLTAFTGVDLTHVIQVGYVFNHTTTGAIFLSDIRFTQ